MLSIIGPQSNNEVVDTFRHVVFKRKRRITKLALAPLVQRMTEPDPPPKGLQTGKAGRPATFVTATIIESATRSTNPRTPLRVEHATSAIAARAEKFRAGVSPVKNFITRKL